MTIPPKCEDLVLKVAELERSEDALREELALIIASFDELAACVGFSEARLDQAGDSPIDCANQLQQRLTVAEQRADELEWLLRETLESGEWFSSALEFQNRQGFELCAKIDAALKPAAECPHNYSNPTGCPVCQGIKP